MSESESNKQTAGKGADQLRRKARDERWRKQAQRRKLIKLLLIFVGLPFGVWYIWTQILYPTYTARYELSIEVETPDGLKTGSSIIEANYGWEPTLFGLISGVKNSVTGEAVFVDLGDRKNLVVTFRARTREGSALKLPSKIFGFPPHHKTKTKTGIRAAMKAGTREVPIAELPFTVTFPDVRDPMSVKELDPSNIGEYFGDGFSIKRAEIRMTRDSARKQIVSKLPWLEAIGSKPLNGRLNRAGNPYGLYGYEFRRSD